MIHRGELFFCLFFVSSLLGVKKMSGIEELRKEEEKKVRTKVELPYVSQELDRAFVVRTGRSV